MESLSRSKAFNSMSLTKDDLTHSIQNHLNFPKRQSAIMVESLLEIIIELAKGTVLNNF